MKINEKVPESKKSYVTMIRFIKPAAYLVGAGIAIAAIGGGLGLLG